MKILNLHGFMGKADNRSYAALCKLLPEKQIISPQLDFMHAHPAELLDSLLIAAGGNGVDLIVGQSLGGAFALLTAIRYGVPCILTNPCLSPAETGVIMQSGISAELLGEYREIRFQRYFGKAYILVSDRDDIIPGNLAVCRKLTPHVRQVSGTHSKIDNLQDELAAILKELEDPEARRVHLTDFFDRIDSIVLVDDARAFDPAALHEDTSCGPEPGEEN